VQDFELIPYPADQIPNIRIAVDIERIENQLSILYAVKGDIDEILLPKPSASMRQDDLWKATCFEFFLAIPDQPEYWEFNMSPPSAWNIYHMDAYRRIGFHEEIKIQQLPFDFQKVDDEYLLNVSMGLSPVLQASQKIQVGITAIIQTMDGNETYWALAHPGPQADFHLRESFIISI
jgi:hypothetical protein